MTTQTNGTHATTEVEGVVSRVNERGLLLDGRPSWLNVSRFAGELVLPDAGSRVRLTLDGAGFIRGVETVEPVLAGTTVPSSPDPLPDRERRILRESVLRTAVDLLGRNGPVTLADVLATAEELESWVLR